MMLLWTSEDIVTVTVVVRVLLEMTIGRALLAAAEGDSFTGVLNPSFGAGVLFGLIKDAESIEVIEATEFIELIELDELGRELNVDELRDTVALDGGASAEVLASTEEGAAVSAGGLPVHGTTVTIEALRTSVNVESALMLLTRK
jgi:hypothetical protein